MQHISRLRSLFALQILFHAQNRDIHVVREMRLSIADTIVHCPTIPVEYVGFCYAVNVPGFDIVTQLRRTVRKPRVEPQTAIISSRAGTDIKGKGKANADVEPDHDDDVGPIIEDFLDEWAIEDSDDELVNWEENSPIVKMDVKMSDIVGVKMWDREIWRLKL